MMHEQHRLQKSMKRNTFFYYAAMIVLVFATLFTMYLGYLLFYPVEVIKPNVQPYKVLTPVVYQGGILKYEINACKFVEVTALASRRLVDGVVINLPMTTNNVKKGCFKSPTQVVVPMEVPPGEWRLQLDIEYKINSFRSITYHFITQQFEVKEATDSADIN